MKISKHVLEFLMLPSCFWESRINVYFHLQQWLSPEGMVLSLVGPGVMPEDICGYCNPGKKSGAGVSCRWKPEMLYHPTLHSTDPSPPSMDPPGPKCHLC